MVEDCIRQDAQLIFLIFDTFVCKSSSVDTVCGEKIIDKCMAKLTELLLAQLHP